MELTKKRMEEAFNYNSLQKKYDKLYKSNKELLDSIYYAESVQRGILPHDRHFKRLFEEYFVLYNPQGIIGGDLYWIGQKGHLKYFAVGDCTGHGVSGAILSVMALNYLNYIVLGKEFNELGEVLQELDKKWIETFHQGSELGYNNDWLEIGICSFNEETKELQFAGAFNKLIYIVKDQLKEIMGNKFPIGGWQLETKREYTTHYITVESPTIFYLYSDGYKDQFGSENRKRYSSKRMKALFLRNSSNSLQMQAAELQFELDKWRGTEDQTDDVCVLGIKLK